MRIAIAQINPTVGAFAPNRAKILTMIEQARGADLVVFPEMALLGYPPGDLVLMPQFVAECEKSLQLLAQKVTERAVIVGTIRERGGRLYNSAAIIHKGEIAYRDKTHLPNYDVFYEKRYFTPADENRVWEFLGKRFAITLCEDIWQEPYLPFENVDYVINLSASPYYMGRIEERLEAAQAASRHYNALLIYSNQVGGNDSLIFDGRSFCVTPKLSSIAPAFEEELLFIDEVQEESYSYNSTDDLIQALVLGTRDYFYKQGFKTALVGLSGGIDSAVVASIATEALGKEHVLALMMPSRFSSKESLEDAKTLVKQLGIQYQELSIEPLFDVFLHLLEPHFKGKPVDVTEENLQARIRGMLLMAFSNKFNMLVLGPGNKSEMAMGYTTLYGDMCAGLGVLSDVTKEKVYEVARHVKIPQVIIDKEPTAELREGQRDSDSLPPYKTIDLVLEEYVVNHLPESEIAKKHNLDPSIVQELTLKIHRNEYKRRQAPPGLRVTKKAFTVGRRFPIVQTWKL